MLGDVEASASASAVLNGGTRAVGQVGGQLLELSARDRHLEVLGPVLIGRDERQVDRWSGPRWTARSWPSRPLRSAAAAPGGPGSGRCPALCGTGRQPVRRCAGRSRRRPGACRRWSSLTSNTPSPTSRTETSKVPPPRSQTRIVSCSFLSRPYASAAAVGSLMMRSTSRPAILPASLVAWRCASLKYAGTVMTACVTRVAEVVRRVVDQLLEDHRRDLLRRVVLAVDLDRVVGAHVALDRGDRAVRVDDRLALRELADEPFAGLGEGHDRRRRPAALGVGNDGGLRALHHGDHGVGRAEIDPDDWCCHGVPRARDGVVR